MKVYALILCMYLSGCFLGITYHSEFIQEGNGMSQEMNKFLTQSKYESFIQISKNNLFANFYVLLCSMLTLGILGAGYMLYNGFIHGIHIGFVYSILSFDEIIFSFAPHSSEILALVGSTHLGYLLSKKIFYENRSEMNYKFMVIYAFVIFCITIISAYLESHVSMQ